jgi:hypothetical protein
VIPLQMALTALCLVCALWLVVLLVLDRTPDRILLTVLAVLEVGLLVHLVVGIVHVTTDAPDRVPVWEYIGYLLGAALFVPVGVVWSSGERSRGSTGVLLLAVLLVPFMFVRLADLWVSGG